MKTEIRLHIAEKLKAERLALNVILPRIDSHSERMNVMGVMSRLDDLEMYIRTQIDETEVKD